MLTDRVRELLSDKNNELVISHAVLWEVLNKVGRRKLLLAGTSVVATMQRIDDLARANGVLGGRPRKLAAK